MPYLIDGHNLIPLIPNIDLADPYDEVKLIDHLKRLMARKRKRCTVVFDHGLPGGMSRELSTHSVEVVFAHSGTDADRIIIERIRKARDPASLIVVSADRRIVDAARRYGARVASPEAFAVDLGARLAPDESDSKPRQSPDELDYWKQVFDANDGNDDE